MNAPAFRPIGDRYLVLPDEQKPESETIGEITLTTKGDPHKVSTSGTIVAKGTGCAEPINVGDRVAYGLYSGYDQVVDGITYKVLRENELLGELLSTPFDAELVECAFCHEEAVTSTPTCGHHLPQ